MKVVCPQFHPSRYLIVIDGIDGYMYTLSIQIFLDVTWKLNDDSTCTCNYYQFIISISFMGVNSNARMVEARQSRAPDPYATKTYLYYYPPDFEIAFVIAFVVIHVTIWLPF